MANPLLLVLPLRYDAVQSVLLVQSGPIDLAIQVAARLRSLFPDAELEGLVREHDRDAVGPRDFDRVTPARWEDRRSLVRGLRRRRYDVVVGLVSRRPESPYLGLLPFLLRTRAILLFNDHLDYFPLRLSRLAAVAQHLRGGAGGILGWLARRLVLGPAALVVLLASTARIYARAARRRSRARA